jgi:flavodoxin
MLRISKGDLMKTLVAYFSLSGNTQQVARAISEVVLSKGFEVSEKDISEITPNGMKDFDLVFLGSACHDADLAEPVKLLLDKIDYSPTFKMAGFVTHATTMPDESERNQELYSKWAGRCIETFENFSSQKGFDFLGYFHCQGVPNPLIAEFIHQEIISDESEWDEYFTEVRQHPNNKDLEKAKAFAREIILKVDWAKK